MRIQLSEHINCEISKFEDNPKPSSLHFSDEVFSAINLENRKHFKIERNKKIYPYSINKKSESTYLLNADYYIGLDWLVDGKLYISVEPKVNAKLLKIFQESLESELTPEKEEKMDTQNKKEIEEAESTLVLSKNELEEEKVSENSNSSSKVNYLKMLLDIYSSNIPKKDIGQLVQIHWKSTAIEIKQKDDQLTPFLVVQFLNLLKSIVRKGLKKSYYKVQENLNNRVKGKILVGTHIKQNVFKNRMTKTFCEYQVFGENNHENKFLKKVFQFVLSYVQNHEYFFTETKAEIDHFINYCRPAFELIQDDLKENNLRNFKYNPFFKEYKEAIKIGNYILKQFAYNISSTTAQDKIETPPFWIDMPRLFELYVYQKLLEANNYDTKKIQFQFKTYGNHLDFLIKDGENSMIIDTKYKLHYQQGHIHEDIRQVSGYARLREVRNRLGLDVEDDRNINCLIIYPTLKHDENETTHFELNKIVDSFKIESNYIKAYHKVYKLGISLPLIK